MRTWFYRHPNVALLALCVWWLIVVHYSFEAAEDGGWWWLPAIAGFIYGMELIDRIIVWWKRT